jgi:predicted transcriptional regulator YdeE
MKVMVIIKATKDSEAGVMPSTEMLAAMGQYNEELVKAGVMLAGEGLHPSSRGARVRFSGKNRMVIDGPFSETKELIAGFWLWRVNSLQEAIEWLKKCPNPMNVESDVEIRQVFEAADFGAEFTPELREQEAMVRATALGLNPPSFQDKPAHLIAGLNQRYTMETRRAIPRQWERFVGRSSGLADRVGSEFYGIAWNTASNCEFDYLTGVEVSSAKHLSTDLTALPLEARRYAIFAHTGHVSELPRTLGTIWGQWAPDCGLKIAQGAPCVERYTAEFNAAVGTGGIEIWVPLESA